MNGLIKAPETRTAVTNASGHALGLNITAKAISFDGGACDALVVMLASNQKFLLKKGFSQRNDTPLHITGFQSVTLSAIGVPTAYANDSITFTFGDALPTLGPQDLQFEGLVVSLTNALPVRKYAGSGRATITDASLAPSEQEPMFTGGTGIVGTVFGASARGARQLSAFSGSIVFATPAAASTIDVLMSVTMSDTWSTVPVSFTTPALSASTVYVLNVQLNSGVITWTLSSMTLLPLLATVVLSGTLPGYAWPAWDFYVNLTNNAASAGVITITEKPYAWVEA